MRPEIKFMPLGGGQRVGASCYYLRLGKSNIILDAGVGTEEGCEFEPDFYSLLTSKYMESMNQIDRIFISHAHMDHVGNLLKLLQEAGQAEVYMTELTKCLAEYQLYDKSFSCEEADREMERLTARNLLERVTTVSFLETLDFGEYKVTFYPAGHIPGAMMILFEYQNRKILYTGDYSIHDTALTEGCIVPEEVEIDTVLMCGLHAKHPWYRRNSGGMDGFIKGLLDRVGQGKSVRCHVSQLSKGVEFLKMLNEANGQRVPIYIDPSIQPVIRKLEQENIRLLTPENHFFGRTKSPHVYLTAEPYREVSGYESVRVAFSLHEDFQEMRELIKRINPKQLYLVHCDKETNPWEDTMEQVIMRDAECRTQVSFAEEQEVYSL